MLDKTSRQTGPEKPNREITDLRRELADLRGEIREKDGMIESLEGSIDGMVHKRTLQCHPHVFRFFSVNSMRGDVDGSPVMHIEIAVIDTMDEAFLLAMDDGQAERLGHALLNATIMERPKGKRPR